jgi:hypothetical protein
VVTNSRRVALHLADGTAGSAKLPTAWLVDVDGTLALCAHRNPYDWRRADADEPNGPVVTVVQALAAHPGVDAVLAISGRPEQARHVTSRWLDEHGITHNELLLRADGDARADEVVKEELFRTRVAPRYYVLGVIDDRDKVVRMWRTLGLVCLQVACGDF